MKTISSHSRWGDEHSSREKITLRHMEGLSRRRPFVRHVSTFFNRPRSTLFHSFRPGYSMFAFWNSIRAAPLRPVFFLHRRRSINDPLLEFKSEAKKNKKQFSRTIFEALSDDGGLQTKILFRWITFARFLLSVIETVLMLLFKLEEWRFLKAGAVG